MVYKFFYPYIKKLYNSLYYAYYKLNIKLYLIIPTKGTVNNYLSLTKLLKFKLISYIIANIKLYISLYILYNSKIYTKVLVELF